MEAVLHLQRDGPTTAAALADVLGVSVRTVYRDVDALRAAGVPVQTDVGRGGGVRLDPSYRVAGLGRLAREEARGVLFAAVPSVARQLGLDPDAAARVLLPAMDDRAGAAATTVRDRLLVEPSAWFVPPDAVPDLVEVARAVWEDRALRFRYRDAVEHVNPVGLVLKGQNWYLLARRRYAAGSPSRLFRLLRAVDVEVLADRWDRPDDVDLAEEWGRLRDAFLERSAPTYAVAVRVAPSAEHLLATLDEAIPDLPLAPDVPRDDDGWALLDLLFEDPDRAAGHLVRLGPDVEALDPPELRRRLADLAGDLVELYAAGSSQRS